MNKAIKYRLYPTKEQEEMFAKTFGCCRKIWNLMLNDKIEYYKATKEMLQTTPAQYKKQEEYKYLKEVDSLALVNVQLHLQTAYKNFFRDKKIGFPKLKSSKYSRKAYTTNNQNGTVDIIENSIKLPKIGRVKAKIHKHTANQRLDFLHKKSTEIANQYDVVCVETLDMKNMANKGFGNGKATLDNGYGSFLIMLKYKLSDRGKYFVKVDKWYPSSQLCYFCGKQHKEMKNLLTRQFVCDCGYKNDRDINASLNIKKEGFNCKILLFS